MDFNEQQKAEEKHRNRLRGARGSGSGSGRISDDDAIRLRGLLIGNGAINGTVQNAATAAPDATPGDRIYAVKEELDAAMEAHIGYQPNYYDYRLRRESCPACVSYNYTAWSSWFLRPEVTKALNVCGNAGEKAFGGTAAGCVNLPGFDKYDSFAYSAALGRALDAGISVTLYYGKQDRACDFVGGYAVANT